MTEIPQPLQIIATGEDEACQFALNEENLNKIMEKIPPDMKVGIIAVVGAFRTGKSFLLNFFLRYLRADPSDLSQSWMVSEGDELQEGNLNEGGWSLVDSVKEEDKSPLGETDSNRAAPHLSNKARSFQWRGGQKRQTTGIWMWSEPFIRVTDSTSGEKIAILLMDTQGMFDNETTMTLTAQIFGLSTLVSSFQVYNVCKQIQEDNLQHLALFSEYGRMALLPQNEQAHQRELLEKKNPVAAAASPDSESSAAEKKDSETEGSEEKDSVSSEEKPKKPEDTSSTAPRKPFQRLQFLIRDWQNFDKDFQEGEGVEAFAVFQHEEMDQYLNDVFKARKASDLQSTREQILRCFEKLDCFMLPYPGTDVTRKNYDGAIKSISVDFKALLNQYVRQIFNKELEAKMINGRFITGLELKNFFEVYVKMFQAGEKRFPQAMTMLEATAEANNRSAYDLGLKSYKDNMTGLVGNDKTYVREIELHNLNQQFTDEALRIFAEIATMGPEDKIAQSRQLLSESMEQEKKRYFETNSLKNPYKDMEYYILPLAVAVASYFLARITDRVCSTDFCERVEDTFQNIYLFVFVMMMVVCWKQIRTVYFYLKEMIPVLTSGAGIDLHTLAHQRQQNKKNN